MFVGAKSKLQCRVALTIIASVFLTVALPTAAAASGISVLVDPYKGDDSSCAATFICRTIAYAVQHVGASHVNLSAGVFTEPTVNINNAASLVVSGVASASFFDCSRRLGQTTGAAFNIANSTVTITGVTFQHCSNTNGNGGALSAVGSSIAVSRCCFINCSAASGGAISASGGSSDMFLRIESSKFSGNSAVGGLIACPTSARTSEPCATWGGAVAAFEIRNVSVTGCTMVNNSAKAGLPSDSAQAAVSRNAVSGGGCLSLLFRGNSSDTTLSVINNSFLLCGVDISRPEYGVGNGIVLSRESIFSFSFFPSASTDTCAGYGGALSVYVGLSAGLQLLHVSFFNVVLQGNAFASCVVNVNIEGGNAHGGAVSLYMGGFSSSYSLSGDAVAAVGDTLVRNVSVSSDANRFELCSVRRVYVAGTRGANVYGASFSFYIGAFVWSLSKSGHSNSTCGGTNATGIYVSLRNNSVIHSEASTSSGGNSDGANAYGGGISVLYIGAYCRSASGSAFSSSVCGATSASDISVHVTSSGCSNCMALTSSGGSSSGANAYGGGMSVLYIGTYSLSLSFDSSSSSACGATSVNDISVHIGSSRCSNCTALTTSARDSLGANAYGGAISASHIGAYSHSSSDGSRKVRSISSVGVTRVTGFSMTIIGASIDDTIAQSGTQMSSYGANVYGGAISVMVGPYVWSFIGYSDSKALSDDTSCDSCTVVVTDTSITSSRASSQTSGDSNGAFVYGGCVALVVHPYVWSWSSFFGASSSSAGSVIVSRLLAIFSNSSFSSCAAVSRTISGSTSCILLIAFTMIALITHGRWPQRSIAGSSSSRVAASGSDVIGGAVAVSAGVHIANSMGQTGSGNVSVGKTSVQHSAVVMNQSSFTECSASSLADTSFGTASVFGGAFAVLHASQVSNFKHGVLAPSDSSSKVTGLNFTVMTSKCLFLQCSATSSASAGRPDEAGGEGGAMYAKSAALTNFSVAESAFIDNRATVTFGSAGSSSFSGGGALSVEAGVSASSLVVLSSCKFSNCAVTVVVTGNASIDSCVFDARASRDTSETSTGLSVVARNSSHAHATVSDCVFLSSTVAISVRCAGDGGARRVAGSCVGPKMMLKNSNIFQIPPSGSDAGFNSTGSALMDLQTSESHSFTGSFMRCALPRFAVFKELSVEPSTNSTVYSCKPCLPFQISPTATAVSLEELSNSRDVDRCFPASNRTGGCPFAIADCTTFVTVSSGFWTNISHSGTLEPARRCPRGYCGCANALNGTCPLPPVISTNREPNPLCIGNRIGKLCGGCPINYTQSLDDRSCISNEACSKSLGWVWSLSVLGFAVYSLYIVVSCRRHADGAFSCLLFYFQISSFAANVDEPGAVSAVIEYAQVRSIVAVYEGACYARSLSAYNATVLKLIGPLFVLLFAVAWTWVIHKLQPRLQQRNIDISVSYSGSLAVVLLFVFSNVTDVVFTLVECSSYSDPDAVVFIDGTVPCKDDKWVMLVFLAALLFLFPAAYAAALRTKQFPASAREAVCGKYRAPVFFWGAVTLSFRLQISLSQFLRVDFPNLMAFVRSSMSIGVLFLLVHLRPYVHVRSFWVDVTCYACLTAQFGLQGFAANRDFLGVAQSSATADFYTNVSTWSAVIRFLPVGVFAISWLSATFHLETSLKDFGRRIPVLMNGVTPQFAALVRTAKRCFGRAEQAPSGREMRTEHRYDSDELKRSLMA